MTLYVNTLDFSMVANNDMLIETVAVDKLDGSLRSLTDASIKWQLFRPGTRSPLVTKSTDDGSITILDQITQKGRFKFQLNAADTFGFETGCYPHEAVVIDEEGNANTLTAGDQKVSAGNAFIRQELTIQG